MFYRGAKATLNDYALQGVACVGSKKTKCLNWKRKSPLIYEGFHQALKQLASSIARQSPRLIEPGTDLFEADAKSPVNKGTFSIAFRTSMLALT